MAQAVQLDDPDGHGLSLELPAFGSAVSVGEQAETSGLADSSPTVADISAPLVTHAGEVEISMPLLDRTLGQNTGIDEILHAALAQDLRTQQDAFVSPR